MIIIGARVAFTGAVIRRTMHDPIIQTLSEIV